MFLRRRDDELNFFRGVWNVIALYMVFGILGVLFMRACEVQ